MKIKIKTGRNLYNLLIYILFSLCCVFLFPTVYYAQNNNIFFLFGLFVLLLVGVYSWVKISKEIDIKIIYFLIFYFAIMGIYWMLKASDDLTFMFYLLFAFPVMLFFNYYLNKENKLIELLRIYVQIVFVIACISLFFWIFASVLKLFSSDNIVSIRWGKVSQINSYFNIYFEPQYADINFKGIHLSRRNCAIFCEAPAACFIFALALLCNLKYCKIFPRIVNTVLIFTLLSTLSSTAYIVLLMMIMWKIFEFKTNSRVAKIIKYILAFASTIIVCFMIYKIVGDKLETGSGVVRGNKIVEECKNFFLSPLMGKGFGLFTFGSSNSFFSLLADGGVVLWGIYYIPIFYKIISNFIKKRYVDWFTIIYAAMFIISAFQYNFVTVYIVSMFWIQIFNEKER